MEIKSILQDKRINAKNVLIEMNYKEYLDIVKKILENNEFQRGKVKSSYTIYSLSRQDLQKGCILPPIVLAIGQEYLDEFNENTFIDDVIDKQDKLLILDGLQRTYTMIEVQESLIESNKIDSLKVYLNNRLRVEVYVGINRIGILYRMLTLNTGQTPMSNRHQLEILFADYVQKDISGIKLIKEIDNCSKTGKGVYKFKDIIDGFNSYLERNELPLDRTDILERISSLEKLSKENQSINLFEEYVETFHKLIEKVDDLSVKWKLDDELLRELNLGGNSFGKDAVDIFAKSQVMTGFGAAIGTLIDYDIIRGFDEIRELIDKLKISDTFEKDMINLIKKLDSIRKTSKKIGNAQRMYFQYYFRELFNKNGDSVFCKYFLQKVAS